MGMDIEGIDPSGDAGAYFRASIWSWPPLSALIQSLIGGPDRNELDLSYLPKWWDTNDGDGLRNQTDCNKLADAVDEVLKTFVGKTMTIKTADVMAANNPNGPMLAAMFGFDADYSIEREHIEEFVTFLRSCGGFKIN